MFKNGSSYRTSVEVTALRACRGRACEMTLIGTLTPANQQKVLGEVRARLSIVNAAMLNIAGLVLVDDAHRIDGASLVNPEAALILLVRKDQLMPLEPFMQERTRRGYTLMIFSEDLLLKAYEWLDFYSRLGNAR